MKLLIIGFVVAILAAALLIHGLNAPRQSKWSIPPVTPTCFIEGKKLLLFGHLTGIQTDTGKRWGEIVDFQCDLETKECDAMKLSLVFLETGKIGTLGFMKRMAGMSVGRITENEVFLEWGVHTYSYKVHERMIVYNGPYALYDNNLIGKKSYLNMKAQCD